MWAVTETSTELCMIMNKLQTNNHLAYNCWEEYVETLEKCKSIRKSIQISISISPAIFHYLYNLVDMNNIQYR